MAYKGLMRNLAVMDWFSDPDKNKYQNYFIRFRKAFAEKDDFVKCFPDDLQNVATEYYPILVEAFPNLLLKFNTKSAALANLKFLVKLNQAKFTRYKELQEITMPDLFSNDVEQKLDSTSKANGTQSEKGNQSSKSGTKNANLKFGNEALGDDGIVDDDHWKSDKYAQDGSTNDLNSNTDSTNDSTSTTSGEQHSTSSKKDTRYSVEGISQLLDMVEEPNAWLMKTILIQMSAPVQLNFETYVDFRGDFR